MDSSYSISRNERNYKWPVVIVLILLILGGIGYFVFGVNKKFISPLPDTPAVEVVFYTPTPEPVTPTSTPSATPKAGRKASPTKKPTPTSQASPTVGKVQPSDTPKP